MIKINLLGMEAFKDESQTRALYMYAASLAAVILACLVIYLFSAGEVDSLAQDVGKLQTDLAQLKVTTNEVRDLEKKKKELSDKLLVIATLKKSKVGPVHILDDLNTAMPDRSWIADMKESAGVMRISGMALDNQTISEFMRALEKSDYFPQVDLVEATQTEKQGVKIHSFVIQAKLSYPGRIKMEMEAASSEASRSPDAMKPKNPPVGRDDQVE